MPYKKATRADCFGYDPREPSCCSKLKHSKVEGCIGCNFYKHVASSMTLVQDKKPSSRKRERVVLVTSGSRRIYPDASALAAALGLSKPTIYNYLGGKIKNPRYVIHYEHQA